MLWGDTPIREGRKEDWPEGKVNIKFSEAADAAAGSAGAGMDLQSCPRLRKGGWAFVSPYQTVIGHGHSQEGM